MQTRLYKKICISEVLATKSLQLLPGNLLRSLRYTKVMAGTRKTTAAIHAEGSPMHTPANPKAGTTQRLTNTLATISKTPDIMESLVKPTP